MILCCPTTYKNKILCCLRIVEVKVHAREHLYHLGALSHVLSLLQSISSIIYCLEHFWHITNSRLRDNGDIIKTIMLWCYGTYSIAHNTLSWPQKTAIEMDVEFVKLNDTAIH